MIFFATSAANQGDLIALEAKRAGSNDVKITSSGVEFSGDLAVGYRFCFQSRISSRLLMGLFIDEDVQSDDELYEATASLDWENYLDPEKTFKVSCTTQNCRWIKNNHYAALKAKDGICDRIKEKFDGARPDIEIEDPDIAIHIHIEGDIVKWYLDFSGENLSMRGYRGEQTEALLKEHLAAALLSRTDWRKTVQDGNPAPLYDPFCGSGTIAIEAALMASDTDPGLLRKKPYAFQKLKDYDENLFESIKQESIEKRDKALEERDIRIFASDKSRYAIEISKAAALKAGVMDLIEFSTIAFEDVKVAPAEKGYIVTDPPYGERMRVEEIDKLYQSIGDELQSVFKGWKATILTGNSDLLSNIDLKPDRTNALWNGPILCQAAHYTIFTEEEREALIQRAKEKKEARLSSPLSDGAQMAYNRIKKNLSEITPIMEKEGVTCYRIYDADMPEYNAAIDFYEGKWIVLSEYQAPDTIDRESAERRLNDLIYATERATGIDIENIYVKQRSQQKGTNQYRRLASSNHQYIARENGVKFLVNFTDYLDTGIFLDHRLVRKMIQEMADGKRFLNLFCYTGTATLNAIKGGAISTDSVDTSNTYLSWMEKNLELNGFSTTMGNFLYKADAIEWLWDTYDRYDLIFCDPPTFSNSSDRRTFDVQRDQKRLIQAAMMHLAPGGTMIFSTNYTKFKLNDEIYEKYIVEDITEKTIGEDFKRNPKIHKCYLLKNKVKIKLNPNRKPRQR